jgi:hypothetical protein
MGSDVEELLATLAEASRVQSAQQAQIDKLNVLIADLAARLYILEMNAHLRPSGSLNLSGLRFVGGASRDTYLNVFKRVRAEQLGIVDDD